MNAMALSLVDEGMGGEGAGRVRKARDNSQLLHNTHPPTHTQTDRLAEFFLAKSIRLCCHYPYSPRVGGWVVLCTHPHTHANGDQRFRAPHDTADTALRSVCHKGHGKRCGLELFIVKFSSTKEGSGLSASPASQPQPRTVAVGAQIGKSGVG